MCDDQSFKKMKDHEVMWLNMSEKNTYIFINFCTTLHILVDDWDRSFHLVC